MVIYQSENKQMNMNTCLIKYKCNHLQKAQKYKCTLDWIGLNGALKLMGHSNSFLKRLFSDLTVLREQVWGREWQFPGISCQVQFGLLGSDTASVGQTVLLTDWKDSSCPASPWFSFKPYAMVYYFLKARLFQCLITKESVSSALTCRFYVRLKFRKHSMLNNLSEQIKCLELLQGQNSDIDNSASVCNFDCFFQIYAERKRTWPQNEAEQWFLCQGSFK